MAVKIYDKKGNYLGTAREDSFIAKIVSFFIFGIGVISGLNWLWEKVTNWQTLEVPYKYIAFFYNYTIVFFIQTLVKVWILGSNLTQYPNLNIVISIVFSISYVFIVLYVVGLLFKLGWRNNKRVDLYFVVILVSPCIFSIMWFFGSLIYMWLFTN